MEALLQEAIIGGWTGGNPGGLPRGDAVWCDRDGYVGVREVLGFWCLSDHFQMRKLNPRRIKWKVSVFSQIPGHVPGVGSKLGDSVGKEDRVYPIQ